MTSSHHVAAIQLNSGENIDANLNAIATHVADAAQRGAKLVLLPENCAYMAAEQGDSKRIAEDLGDLNGTVQSRFAELAAANHIWLIVGAFPTIENGNIYQTSLVFDAAGNHVAHYHKRHLFNVTLPDGRESYRESDAFEYGDDVVVVPTPVGNVGLSICYDLRFPKHFNRLVDAGAEILTLPAAFTHRTGKAHWEVLLRARAIENQCYVIASGQVGHHPGNRQTWGHSLIIDPWGKILAEQAEQAGSITAHVDLAELHHLRSVFPTLEHQRD